MVIYGTAYYLSPHSHFSFHISSHFFLLISFLLSLLPPYLISSLTSSSLSHFFSHFFLLISFLLSLLPPYLISSLTSSSLCHFFSHFSHSSLFSKAQKHQGTLWLSVVIAGIIKPPTFDLPRHLPHSSSYEPLINSSFGPLTPSSMRSFFLPFSNYFLPFPNYFLPFSNYFLPFFNFSLPFSTYFFRSPTIFIHFQTVSFRSLTISFRSSTTSFRPPPPPPPQPPLPSTAGCTTFVFTNVDGRTRPQNNSENLSFYFCLGNSVLLRKIPMKWWVSCFLINLICEAPKQGTKNFLSEDHSRVVKRGRVVWPRLWCPRKHAQ